jgi:hypothetical protein
MARTFKASPAGYKIVCETFDLSGKTQDYLAGNAHCSRSTVINFLAGKPVQKRAF